MQVVGTARYVLCLMNYSCAKADETVKMSPCNTIQLWGVEKK